VPIRAQAERRPLLSIVVPTFNEEENVARLVSRVGDALDGIDFEIIFVDDSSDATPQIVMGLQTPFPVKLIHREPGEREGGLTTAILRGLRAARGVYVSVIDGDLQHPPEKLSELLRTAEGTGADVVIASRYRKGGSAAGLPGYGRRLISVASKWISKLLFYERLHVTSDPGSGFFLLRSSVIHGIELRPIGYKMLTEVLVRGSWTRVDEVPYRFEARKDGASKAGLRQGWQYIQHTMRIFVEVPHVARAWKFLLVGASGVIVNLGLLWASTEVFALPRYLGWAIGVEGSVTSNFLLNRTFTWRDRRADGLGGVAQAARYHVSSAVGIAANFVAFTAATLLDAPTLLAGMLGIAAGVGTNFVGAAQYVFAPKRQEPPAPGAEPLLFPVTIGEQSHPAAAPGVEGEDYEAAA
jgi:dolichol-phosphate mannosyltransferase